MRGRSNDVDRLKEGGREEGRYETVCVCACAFVGVCMCVGGGACSFIWSPSLLSPPTGVFQ